MELNAIAAVAVGGTSLMGGRATILGSLVGALFIQLVRYTLLTEGIEDSIARVITAATIIVAVLLQRRSAR
jgi:ribose/xylose/arabinose/galactoside ABC-type transport system permease subunit